MTTRRTILGALALAGASAPFAGCERIISRATRELGVSIPDAVEAPSAAEVDPLFHLLSRAGHGPWPGELDRARAMGASAWIDEQLAPDAIDDAACDLRARRFETIHLDPGMCYEFKRPVLRDELVRHALLRAVYSRRQLFEVMVDFWSDHLNVSIDKGDGVYLKASDDRTVVRAHAFGRFRDLVRASATSPAMLVYLDGKENVHAAFGDVPNENYARELLELHTLGVDGGYSQRDVREAARCLTGWRVRDGWRRGAVELDPSLHDDGEKTVLGATIPAGGGGEADLERLMDVVCSHPSTARHIARKLARRFVSDDPPASVVDLAAETFTATGGEIAPTVRALLTSPEFAASAGAKIKRPFELVASALRALGADTHAHAELTDYLARMGQAPFQHPTPDGYADEARPWLGTLLWRWNFAFALAAGDVPGATVPLDALVRGLGTNAPVGDLLFAHCVGRAPTARESAALANCGSAADAVALVLASPAFQRH